MKTIEEVMELLNVTSKKTIYYRLRFIDIGEPVYIDEDVEIIRNNKKRVQTIKTRCFTDEQVEMIINMPVSKGGRGHKSKWNSKKK